MPAMPPVDRLLLTCEHGGNRIPTRYRAHFRGAAALLATHRGWDIGALALARRLARGLGAPLIAAEVSRLVVDLNRSPGHPNRFSEFTRGLPRPERERIVREHYRPYRERVEDQVRRASKLGERLLHVAVHSFTPDLHGFPRKADFGLLYDPARPREAALARRWQALLRREAPELRTWLNSPYRGWTDGLITHLRHRHPAARYLGVEIEVNQKHLQRPESARRIAAVLLASLRRLMAESGGG